MSILPSQTIREITNQFPNSLRLLEGLGIDYCCGGGRSIAEACAASKVPFEQVAAQIEAQPPESQAWPTDNMAGLATYIENVHHSYVRNEIPRITALLDKVCAKHSDLHPELLPIQEKFADLAAELTQHMMKEERVLFPYLKALASGGQAQSCFGAVQNPIRVMMAEHENAGDLLVQIRTLTNNYQLPDGACKSYQVLYDALHGFERDLHQHVHLENNILFPQAMKAAAEPSVFVA